MKYRLLAGLFISFFVVVGSVSAAVIDVGTHDLLENTPGQTISILATDMDMVTAFNLRAQIGDGMSVNPEPVFQAVSFSGGVWDSHTHTVTGGPVVGAEQFAQGSVVFNTSGDETPPSGLLVTLTIDTTGFFDGESFSLLFSGTDIGTDSDFVLAGGSILVPTINNGTINIVPEPASMVLLTLGGLALIRRRKVSGFVLLRRDE